MSTIFIALIVNLLAQLLPHIGLTLGTDQITGFAQVIVALGTAGWIAYQRTKLQKAPDGMGDVTLAGIRK